MNNGRKTLKEKAIGTELYHVIAKLRGLTVYSSVIEATNKQKARDIVLKKAVVGKLIECGIAPNTPHRNISVECFPIKSKILSEMTQIQKQIIKEGFPPWYLN